MSMSNFDDWKNKLENHESDISPSVWANIEMALPKKKKRRIGWIWLFGIVVIMATGYGLLIHDWSPEDVTDTRQTVNNTPAENNAEAKLTKEIDQTDAKVANLKTQSLNGTGDLIKDQVAIPIVEQPAEELSSPALTASKENEELEKNIVAEIVSKNNLLNAYASSRVLSEEIKDKHDPSRGEYLDKVNSLTILPSIPFEIEYSDGVTFDRCMLPDPPIGCPDLNRKSGKSGLGLSKWVLDLSYGPGVPIRFLTAKSSEGQAYQTLRSSNETPVFDQMIQARLSYVSRQGVAVRTGLNYAHLVERLDYARDSISRNTITITIDTVFNPDGSFNIVRDTISNRELGRLDKRRYNHFRTIQIPLILGFEKRIKNWTFHINGGAMFNLYLNRKGEILDAMDQVRNMSTGSDELSAFKDRWDILLYGSLGVNYRIYDRIHLMAEPSIRYTLKPITTPSYSLDQKYMLLNLNLGVRYEF